jgi:hypothetical protein
LAPVARLFQAIAISTVLTTAWAAVRLIGNPLGRLWDIGLPWFLRRAGQRVGAIHELFNRRKLTLDLVRETQAVQHHA